MLFSQCRLGGLQNFDKTNTYDESTLSLGKYVGYLSIMIRGNYLSEFYRKCVSLWASWWDTCEFTCTSLVI